MARIRDMMYWKVNMLRSLDKMASSDYMVFIQVVNITKTVTIIITIPLKEELNLDFPSLFQQAN